MPDPDAEWWTTTDIAAYLGVQVGTISSYRNRSQMPEPDHTEGRTHLWKPARIISWHTTRPRPGVGGRGNEPNPPIAQEFLSVSTATETREVAEGLAKRAVEAKLAAGAQITGPVISAFWHLGEFGTGEEWRLVLQTHRDRYSELEDMLRKHHTWEKPEIAAVPIVAGSSEYFGWIRTTVGVNEHDL
jgi:periplasmic divalent cation tolerance protein